MEWNSTVWFVVDDGMEGGGNEDICREPKALETVFTGPYLRTNKRLFYDFYFIFLSLFSIFIMDTGL